ITFCNNIFFFIRFGCFMDINFYDRKMITCIFKYRKHYIPFYIPLIVYLFIIHLDPSLTHPPICCASFAPALGEPMYEKAVLKLLYLSSFLLFPAFFHEKQESLNYRKRLHVSNPVLLHLKIFL